MSGENDVIKVYIVAASAVARAGLEAVVRSDEKLLVAGGAVEISAVPFGFSSAQSIDVLLTNVEREKDFAALLEFLGDETADPTLAVVALVAPDFQSLEWTMRLLRGGARGILPFEATSGEITAAIGAAANNLIAAAPEMLDALVSAPQTENFLPSDARDAPNDEAIESLTAREREVLEMLGEGASNKAIAYGLNISEHTVKFHVASIFGKLGVNTRTEAVTQALRRGLILL